MVLVYTPYLSLPHLQIPGSLTPGRTRRHFPSSDISSWMWRGLNPHQTHSHNAYTLCCILCPWLPHPRLSGVRSAGGRIALLAGAAHVGTSHHLSARHYFAGVRICAVTGTRAHLLLASAIRAHLLTLLLVMLADPHASCRGRLRTRTSCRGWPRAHSSCRWRGPHTLLLLLPLAHILLLASATCTYCCWHRPFAQTASRATHLHPCWPSLPLAFLLAEPHICSLAGRAAHLHPCWPSLPLAFLLTELHAHFLL